MHSRRGQGCSFSVETRTRTKQCFSDIVVVVVILSFTVLSKLGDL